MRFIYPRLVLCGLTLAVVALPLAVAAQPAAGVSPGSVDEMLAIENSVRGTNTAP